MSKKIVIASMFALACHASVDQWAKTGIDAAKDGACIAIALYTGSDPLLCKDATEQLVVDIANDIEAKQNLSPEQRSHIDGQRVRMVSRMAQKVSGK